MKPFSGTLLFLLLPAIVFSITPQFWEEYSQEHFTDGDPQSVSITSEGELLLAPQLKKIVDGTESIIWKITEDSSGNLYAGTGNEGKILKIDTGGKAKIFLDTNELEVQALIVDKEDNLFAATSPDGKIYKIKKDGTSSVFFDPPDKYIWSLTLDDAGNLYAGTGDQGKVYRMDQKGNGTVFVDTSETNITALAWDKKKALLAGSDKNGILYRIDAAGKAFVLYDSDLQQITSIYSDDEGDLYFAAISSATPSIEPKAMSEPSPTLQVPTTPAQTKPEDPEQEEPDTEVTTSVEISTPIAVTPTGTAVKPAGISELMRVNGDGSIEEIYSSAEDQILDISGYKEDQVLVSTGKKAKLILVDNNKKSTILLKATEEQITSLLKNGRILVATANPGNVYQLVEQHSAKGTYYSDIKDTLTSSSWGRISWKAAAPVGTQVQISTRSGNTKTPDETWSGWQIAGSDPDGKQISNPKARFIQWKAEFTTTDPKISPVLRKVTLAYLQQNLRPEVVSITVHPAGAVYRRASIYPQESFAGVIEETTEDKNNDDQQTALLQTQSGVEATLGKKEFRKSFQTITWNATDQNQDMLSYDLFYRGSNEKDWKRLAKEVKENVYAWDTQTIPDGTYLVRVVVNDSRSNPAPYGLTNSKESQPFDVDNSAPNIEVVKTFTEKGARIVEVRVQDRFSAIKELQFSNEPGVWKPIFPTDAINDSPTETYRIELKEPANDNLVLKCSDRADNITTIRYELKSTPAAGK